MQLPLVLTALIAAMTCHAQMMMLAHAGPMSLVGRQVIETCPAGSGKCSNQQGCCPLGISCIGNGLCGQACDASSIPCADGHCCNPGFTCPAVAGQPCEVAETFSRTRTSTSYSTSYSTSTDTYYDSATSTATGAPESTVTATGGAVPSISAASAPQPTIATGAAGRSSFGSLGALPLAGMVMALV